MCLIIRAWGIGHWELGLGIGIGNWESAWGISNLYLKLQAATAKHPQPTM